MESKATKKLLKGLKLISRECELDEFPDDYDEPQEHQQSNISASKSDATTEGRDSGASVVPQRQFSPIPAFNFDDKREKKFKFSEINDNEENETELSSDKTKKESQINNEGEEPNEDERSTLMKPRSREIQPKKLINDQPINITIEQNDNNRKTNLKVKSLENPEIKIKQSKLKIDAINPICIKFGSNEHPLLKYWLTLLTLTGAPVLFIHVGSQSRWRRLKNALSLMLPFALLVIYHSLFLLSASRIMNSAKADENSYYSVWLEYYPLAFNLAVIIVNDVMWTIGVANDCWMCDVLQSFKEMPPARNILTEIRYNYYGGQHTMIINGKKYRCGDDLTKTKMQARTEWLWRIFSFGVSQLAAVGCCFTYLYVNYCLLITSTIDFYFALEIINIMLTCSSWLAILWTYMTLCQVLKWRFEHLNDWMANFMKQRVLPNMREFHILTATYQSYLNRVTIIDDFFKYWIFGIFGVLFFQVSIYFQYVIDTIEDSAPSFSLLVIPLVTIPFITSLLLLIKKAADVNAESKIPDEIIVQIGLRTRDVIKDHLYKKMKFFMWLVAEGSSLTIFGLVDITKEFLGSAIVIIFSFTLILHEFTPEETPCDILAKNLTLLTIK